MNTLKNLLSLNDDERLLAEVRTYQEKLISNADEPIWERKWLTIEEAAAYSGIGRTKLVINRVEEVFFSRFAVPCACFGTLRPYRSIVTSPLY